MDMYGYTQHIENHYWGYLKQVNHKTIQQLQTVAINDSEAEIDAAIERFRLDYTCSARRYLMSFFQQHAAAVLPQMKQYTYIWNGNVFLFSTVCDSVVHNLEPEERDQYIQLICEISAANSGDTVKQWRPLIRKAMLWNKRMELIGKQEAFQIGHGLKFSLEEMNNFLLRVLDNEDLSYSRAEDVIEAFCFLYEPANNWHTANALKATYAARSANITYQVLGDKPADFTVKLETSLKSRIRHWQENGRDVLEQFMEWLLLRAPYMDLPSYSATQIYRQLAAFAYEITEGQRTIVEERDLVPQLLDYCQPSEPVQYANDTAFNIASSILATASLEFDNLRKRQPEQVWRYLTVNRKGEPTAVAIGERIPDLLLGRLSVTKADLLFLLWYISDLCWLENGAEAEGRVIADRIADYWTMAEELLEAARLPAFYAPHMLERCFLKAICSVQRTAENPFEIYEGMCEFVLPEKQVRNRSRQGARSDKSRAILEKEVLEEYASGNVDFEGVERRLAEHLLVMGAERRKYVFSREGISYLPNPEIIISYPNSKTGMRFDQSAPEYTQQQNLEERFRYVYGLSLYLIEMAARIGITCEFRTNYQKNVSLTILKWTPT